MQTASRIHETQLLKEVEALRDRQLQWTRDLIAIPTVNPYSGDASAGSEAAGQTWIEDQLRSLGAHTFRVPVPPDVYMLGGLVGPADRRWEGRENVVGRWVLGSGRGQTLIVNNHMDTVGVEGMTIDPFDPMVRAGKLYGRGATDTKGNMVMGLIAIEALLRHTQGLNGQIIFQSVVDEECSGAGAGTLACCLAGIRGDVAVVLDGAVGQVINGCNGIATARVLIRGRAGHQAQGTSVSAIDKAVAVKQAIDRFADELLSAHPSCRTNIGVFRSGTLPSIVPGLAELQVNMSYPLEDAVEAERTTGRWGGDVFRGRFEEAITSMVESDPWFHKQPMEIQWIKDSYPYLTDADDDTVRLAATAASQVHGKPIPIAPMPAWFDGAHLARQLNIPAFSLGHGTPGCAHSADEYVMLEDLWCGAKTVALTLDRLLRC